MNRASRSSVPASLAGLLALVWILLVATRAFGELRAERYLSLGYDHLAALLVRDVVRNALPLLVVGVPLAVVTRRLVPRPRALAALSLALPLLVGFAWLFPHVNDALRGALPRAARGLALAALALVPPLAGLLFARTAGASRAGRVVFVSLAGGLEMAITRVRTGHLARVLGRRAYLAFAGVVALAAWLLPAFVAPSPPTGPPLVVVLVDTLRADHLGVYGYSRATSPHVDAWARGAVVFDRGISQASWTKPSVASLFTGVDPWVHRTGSGTRLRRQVREGTLTTVEAPADAPETTGTLAPELVTFAEVLRNAGYRTAAYVANGLLSPRDGYAQGFSTYEILDDRALTRAGVRFIGEHAREPFLLYLHYMAPHAPYDPPAAFDRFGTPPDGHDTRFDIHHTSTKDSINFTRTLHVTDEMRQEMIDQYDGEIAFADELIESIFSALDDAGIGDRAVVFFTADHGEAFMDHGMVWHESIHLYDELVRVPFIWRAGSSAPRRVADPVMHVDVGPTLLDLAGVPAPVEMQGRSLAPILAGEPLPRRNAYSETIDWGVKQATWERATKLIVDREEPGLELYDLTSDPEEMEDLAADRVETRAALLDSVNTRREENDARRSHMDVDLDALTDEQLERLRSLGYVQ